MKTQSLPKLFIYVALCFTLLFAFGIMAGCKGSDGANGTNGTNGTNGAPGPAGSFASSLCIDCHHLDNNPQILPGLIIPAYGVGGGNKSATAGVATLLTASTTIVPGVTATGYFWSQIGGLPATITAPVTAQSVTITINASPNYLGALIAAQQIPGTSTPPELNALNFLSAGTATTAGPGDRTAIIPVASESITEGSAAEFMVTMFGSDGNVYFDQVNVTENGAAAALAGFAPRETTGVRTVPVGGFVLLNARGSAATGWVASAGTVTAVAGTQYAVFSPASAGTYSISVTTTPTGTTTATVDSLSIVAGTWRGEISNATAPTFSTSGQWVPTPDSACTGCHVSGGLAVDNFTPWKNTGHAQIFSQNLDAGGHYGSSCFPCHTVGFKYGVAANGFDLQPNYATFITDTSFFSATTDNTRYGRMFSTPSYTALFTETNIQCENCHGPQGNGAGGFVASHMSTTVGVVDSTRTSMRADMCGSCHGEPTRHGRFQQWNDSPTGHSNYALAAQEGANASCAGCHSAQGNLILIGQLQAGNPLRLIPAASIYWNAQTVQPQACAVCHDPHNEGTTTTQGPAYSNETIQTNASPRITGSTPKLPGGFSALGVGKGAECFICHNSRNGGVGSTGASGQLVADAQGRAGAFLHEDNDAVFGDAVSTTITSYAAPHSAAQGDVLLGHNAYFMGNSGGDVSKFKSPHATITDTCVTCHMEKTAPPALLSNAYGGTNHTFVASMSICNGCHGIDPGLGPKLQTDTQTALNNLATDLQQAVISQATGTYAGNIATVTFAPSGGSFSLSLTYLNGTAAATGVNPNAVVPLTSDSARNLAKCFWNYFLISYDQSLGVHNPAFARNVISATDTMARSLQ